LGFYTHNKDDWINECDHHRQTQLATTTSKDDEHAQRNPTSRYHLGPPLLGRDPDGASAAGLGVRPGHLEDTGVHVSVVEVGEQGGGHVEVSVGAARAEVDNLGSLGLAGGRVGDLDVLTLLVSGVSHVKRTSKVTYASAGRVLGRVHGDDVLGVRVGPSASLHVSQVFSILKLLQGHSHQGRRRSR
jgi:hypothetical protein